LKLYIAKYFTKKIWETISDLNVHVQVAKASVFSEDALFSDFAKNWDWNHSFGT
jgi:hypothetical protein